MHNQSDTASSPHLRLLWYILKYFLTGMLLGSLLGAEAQSGGIIHPLAGKLEQELKRKSEKLNQALQMASLKHLRRMEAGEQKLKEKLAKKDPALAAALFAGVANQYAEWTNWLTDEAPPVPRMQRLYSARLDSLQTALDFFKDAAGPDSSGLVKSRLITKAGKTVSLQQHFGQGEMMMELMEKRSAYLQQQLQKLGYGKEIKQLQGQVIRYQRQLQDYRQILTRPNRLEAEVLELVRKAPRFKTFFETHSALAGLFPTGTAATALPTAAGVQSREAVIQSLAQKVGSPAQVQKVLTEQLGGMQSLSDRLKQGLPGYGSGGETDMPVSVPQNARRRQFADRFELGTNLQTTKQNRFFPSTTDVGLSLGYRVNARSVVGIGGSYKMGWGGDLRHVRVSSQGAGVRTFIDYKWKGSLWLTGGAEMNYKAQFADFDVLRNFSAWQRSALLGVSKKYRVSSKVKGQVQLLYDALWKQQVPRTQPVVFRLGYQLK